MIYAITTETTRENSVKIGYTSRSIDDRIFELQTGSPFKIKILFTIDGTLKQEQEIHRLLKLWDSLVINKLALEGEWYKKRKINIFLEYLKLSYELSIQYLNEAIYAAEHNNFHYEKLIKLAEDKEKRIKFAKERAGKNYLRLDELSVTIRESVIAILNQDENALKRKDIERRLRDEYSCSSRQAKKIYSYTRLMYEGQTLNQAKSQALFRR